MYGMLAFVEKGKAFQGKAGQRSTLHAFKQLAHLLLGRVVDPHVGNGRFSSAALMSKLGAARQMKSNPVLPGGSLTSKPTWPGTFGCSAMSAFFVF